MKNRIFLTLFLIISSVHGQAADSNLSFVQENRYRSLCESFRIASCDSISIAQGQSCPIARHLGDFARWLVSKNTAYDTCLTDLAARHDCMTSNEKSQFDTRGLPAAGDSGAPVLISVYISAGCPSCKFLSSKLYHEVTAGSLKGRARFVAKPSTEAIGDIALCAAATRNRFWEFLLALNDYKSRPDRQELVRMADSLGIDAILFDNLLNNNKLKSTLGDYARERRNNDVSITPTFYINTIRYRSYKDVRWIIDAALYKYECCEAGP
jgi:hypothetical protein